MKVSVCLATYNGEKYLREQLDSILSQLGASDQIIISDDSSTDDTLEIIRSFNDQRIEIYSKQCFSSPIYNFENAIRNSDGDVIILADQDDIWLPFRVEEILSELKLADLVVTNAYIVDDKLNSSGETLFKKQHSKKGFFYNLKKNSYVGCCMAFNAVVKTKILPFPRNIPMHDQWIGLIAELFYKIKFISNPSLLYRRHELNASMTGKVSDNTIWVKLKYRIQILSALLFYTFKRLHFFH